jgi:hypothetical protein
MAMMTVVAKAIGRVMIAELNITPQGESLMLVFLPPSLYLFRYVKLITSPLGIEGEINDVRPSNSDPLEWYWEVGILWRPNLDLQIPSPKPMSLHHFAGPGTSNPSVQRTFQVTFDVPTRTESMFWYTGRMDRAGQLLRMKLHAHSSLLEEAMFFAASPEELGLVEQHGFSRSPPSLVVSSGEVGFKDSAMMREYIFSMLEESSERGKAKGLNDDEAPRIICHSLSAVEMIDGLPYDRSSPTSCDHWKWKRGRVFTVIAFNRWRGDPLGTSSASLPLSLPGQVNYWLSYDSMESPAVSHWEYSLHNRYADGGLSDALQVRGYQKIAEGLNGFTSPHFHDWTRTPHALIGYVILKALQHLVLSLLLLLLSLSYGLYLMYVVWIKMSRETRRQRKKTEGDMESEADREEDKDENLFWGSRGFLTSVVSGWLTETPISTSPSLEMKSRPHSSEPPIDEETQSLLQSVEE